MPDKKISELDLVTTLPNGDDVSLLVRNGTDYRFTFAQLLSYLTAHLETGGQVSFVTVMPQNITGNNGDVSLNTANGKFYQKRNGSWTEVYSPNTIAGAGSAILYGTAEPLNTGGQVNDTYINVATGRFYQKQSSSWQLVFTMQNGPAGGPGPKGDTGAAGANGKSLLSGTVNPGNQTDGTNGDFYLNTNTYILFGPKTNGDWGQGQSLIPDGLESSDIGPGLTIADDKLTLDLDTKQLVSPAITVQWTLWQNDGITPYSPAASASKNLVVDKGVKADMVAKYKYPVPSAAQALPTAAASASFSTALPGAGVFSAPLTVNGISANRTDTITLSKPKSGLLVAGGQVVFASGNDTTADSTGITFCGRGLMLYSDKATLTAADVQDAYNVAAFQTTRANTFTGVTPGVAQYFYYVYDADLEHFTAVLYNDAEAYFGAFQFQEGGVTVVNNAGISRQLIVARSNATNAFNNSKLYFY